MSSPLTALPTLDPRVFAVIYAPDVSLAALSDYERTVMTQLAGRLMDGTYQQDLILSGLYYHGLNAVPSLGISVPPELESLRAILGWCSMGVDARSERLSVQGFRMPGELVVDEELQSMWQHNNLDAESKLVHEAAMIYGRAFVVVGVGDDGEPLITTESPMNMVASWDVRNRCVSAAYQTYIDVDPASDTYTKQLATLYTRDSTIQLVLEPKGWIVQDRNDHHQGFTPVVQFTCRASINDRMGTSEITAAWRNTQDRACRSLVSMEVAREFFAAPKVWLLGASEQAFLDSEGNTATAWETFIGRLSALEADQYGNLPDVKVTPGSSPDGFIRALDHERLLMAGHTGLPPHRLGIFSDGNPTSADAIRLSDFALKSAADRLTVTFGDCWEQAMRMALQVEGSSLPEESDRMETDWAYTGIPTPNADAVTVTTQVSAGMIPADSDDALAACGWTPVQRARIANAREENQQDNADQITAGQPLDGEQPQALTALELSRSTDSGLSD